MKAIIEGLLFLSGEDGLSLDEISKLIELDNEETKKIINDMYDSDLKFKAFNEMNTRELYEILKLRVSVFVVEQNCVYQDLDLRQ